MKIKKIILVLLAVMLLAVPMKAMADYSDAPRVVDDRDILTTDQIEELSEKLNALSAKYDMDIVIFIESTCPEDFEAKYGDKRAEYYCADLFDYGGYTDNGFAFLINVDERKWALVTEGVGLTLFPKSVRDSISKAFLSYLKVDDFSGAAYAFVYSVTDYLDEELGNNSSDDEYQSYEDYENMSFGDKLSFMLQICIWSTFSYKVLLIAAGVGLVIALIRNGILKGQLRSVRKNDAAANYVVDGSLSLKVSMDTYLYTTQTRTKRAEDNSSSDSFVSSSGDTHSGSSGDF